MAGQTGLYGSFLISPFPPAVVLKYGAARMEGRKFNPVGGGTSPPVEDTA